MMMTAPDAFAPPPLLFLMSSCAAAAAVAAWGVYTVPSYVCLVRTGETPRRLVLFVRVRVVQTRARKREARARTHECSAKADSSGMAKVSSDVSRKVAMAKRKREMEKSTGVVAWCAGYKLKSDQFQKVKHVIENRFQIRVSTLYPTTWCCGHQTH